MDKILGKQKSWQPNPVRCAQKFHLKATATTILASWVSGGNHETTKIGKIFNRNEYKIYKIITLTVTSGNIRSIFIMQRRKEKTET